MKPHLQVALGAVALAAGVTKTPALAAALAGIQSPYTAGYALGVGAVVLLLSLAGARLIGRGLYKLGMPSGTTRLPENTFQ